jgi:hypothetical protein
MAETGWRRGRAKKLKVAFYLWAKGYFDGNTAEAMKAEPTATLLSEMEGVPGIWNEEKKTYGIRVQRNKIYTYATEDFWEAAQMWQDWKTFGFLCAGGTEDQPALYLDIIRSMENFSKEYRNVEA